MRATNRQLYSGSEIFGHTDEAGTPQDSTSWNSRTIMRNNYEMPEALELGEAKTLILGMKVFEPEAFDDIQGLNWKELPGDIDESDE
jgi:hypothetical protein